MMKKRALLLLGVILSCLAIVSCSSDDDNNDNKDLNKYFTVENGSYAKGNIPTGDKTLISNVKVNKSVINGGSTILSFTSTKKLEEAYIGVKGEAGFYKCDLSNVKTTKAVYTYQMLLYLNQDLNVDDFIVSLSALAEDGTLSKSVDTQKISVIEVGAGLLQVSISWDQQDDVDLHLFEPDGNEIYFGERYSYPANSNYVDSYFYLYLTKKYSDYDVSSLDIENSLADRSKVKGYARAILKDKSKEIDEAVEFALFAKEESRVYAFLDLDSNADCDIDGTNNENITYMSKVKKGTYTVAVDLYKKCGDRDRIGSTYSVTVYYKGKPVVISDKQVGQFADDYYGSRNVKSKFVTIGTFTINEGDDVSKSTFMSADNKAEESTPLFPTTKAK